MTLMESRTQATLLAFVAGLLLAGPAMAGGDPHEGHAGDVFVGVEDGHIVTGLIDEDNVEPGMRVFASELGETGVDGFSDEPGWEAFPGTFSPDARIGWNAPHGLTRWNGDGFDEDLSETMTVSYASLSFVIGNSPTNGFDLAV